MDTTAKDSVCPVSVLNVSHDISSQDIEEGRDVYHLGGFHPVYIGDVYHDRYEVLNKVGYGAYSTVWLARDLKASLV
jgi:serine/threonine-protein kinase SRPK3